MRSVHQRGSGRIGFLFSLAVLGAVIFVGVKVVPVRIDAYQFRDVLREEARMGALRRNDEDMLRRILNRAEELDIPLDRKNIAVRRSPGRIVVSARYEQAIDLRFTTWVYRFEAREEAPLF